MLTIILTVCSLASPETCGERRLAFADVTAMQCVLHGQEAAAEWLGEHPGLRVAKWRCGSTGDVPL